MLPLAPACNQYVFNGDFTFRNDRSGPISFNSTGPVASGTVRAGTDSGTVTGTIQGRNVDFTITWGGQTVYAPFKYTGTVGDDALIHDGVVDDAIYWHHQSARVPKSVRARDRGPKSTRDSPRCGSNDHGHPVARRRDRGPKSATRDSPLRSRCDANPVTMRRPPLRDQAVASPRY
jgi:hypothetical protein